MYSDADRERDIQIYNQLTGSRNTGEYAGWPTMVPDSDFKATIVDYIRINDARLLRVEKAVSDLQVSQAQQSTALTNIQAALQRLEQK